MAANPTLVQSANAVSSAAGPTSITPTFGSGTGVGTFLVLVVGVAGTTVAITTPAGWTLVPGASFTSAGVMQVAFFTRPNNPGGITAVAVTVTATAGSAVASVFEFSGMPIAPTNDFSDGNIGAATGTQTEMWTPPPFNGELIFLCGIFNSAQTLSSFKSGGAAYSANTAGGTSTLGTPNLTIANWWALTPGPGGENDAIVLSSGTLFARMAARFQTGANGPLYGAGAGPEGQLVLANSPNPQGSWSIG